MKGCPQQLGNIVSESRRPEEALIWSNRCLASRGAPARRALSTRCYVPR